MAFTQKELELVMGMSARGDKKHDIAAWFGTNQGRVAEAEDGKFGPAIAAPLKKLPPRGAPGLKGRALYDVVTQAIESLQAGDARKAQALLESGIGKFNQDDMP